MAGNVSKGYLLLKSAISWQNIFCHRERRDHIAACGRNQIFSHEGIYNAVKSTKGHEEKKVLVPFISEYCVFLITCSEIMMRKKQ